MGVRWWRWGPHEIKVGRGLTWKNNNISLEWIRVKSGFGSGSRVRIGMEQKDKVRNIR